MLRRCVVTSVSRWSQFGMFENLLKLLFERGKNAKNARIWDRESERERKRARERERERERERQRER